MPDVIIEILGEDDFDVRDKLPARIREALANANNKICPVQCQEDLDEGYSIGWIVQDIEDYDRQLTRDFALSLYGPEHLQSNGGFYRRLTSQKKKVIKL